MKTTGDPAQDNKIKRVGKINKELYNDKMGSSQQDKNPRCKLLIADIKIKLVQTISNF